MGEAQPLRFRAARADDLPQIEILTRDIWEGHDYLPKVWRRWVESPRSLLRVGLLGEQIVTTGRVVEQLPGGWWLEGMRVHPAYQGRGYASQLYHHLVELAGQQPGRRWLGLSTSWETPQMARLAQQSGMTRRGEYRYLRGLAQPAAVPGVEILSSVELARLQAGAWLQASRGFVMAGWVARPVDAPWLTARSEAGDLWRYGEAIMWYGRGSYGDEQWIYLLEGGSPAEQQVLVRQAQYLAHEASGPQAVLRCFVPMGAPIPPLLEAGLGDPDDEGEFRLYHFVRDFEVHDAS